MPSLKKAVFGVFAAGIFVCLCGITLRAHFAGPDPLSVTLVLPDADGGSYLDLTKTNPHLDAIIRNTSNRPVNIWSEWCSWGWGNLSLEITALDGRPLAKPIPLTKRGRAWAADYPSHFVLAPGQMIVRELSFTEISQHGRMLVSSPRRTRTDGKIVVEFVNIPDFPVGKPGQQQETATIRAVYDVPVRDAAGYAVWTGRIESQAQSFTVQLPAVHS
jgi:hypothetical protein